MKGRCWYYRSGTINPQRRKVFVTTIKMKSLSRLEQERSGRERDQMEQKSDKKETWVGWG